MADRSSLWKEFKQFLLRGNVVELAVAVVIGLAFKSVIDAVVDIILNIVAIPGTKGPNGLAGKYIQIGGGTFRYGVLLESIITFVIVAAAVFYAVVVPMNRLAARRGQGPDDPTRSCPECLSAIPKAASRCAFCTAQVTPIA
jgi:large conductance mechanosensitive channel